MKAVWRKIDLSGWGRVPTRAQQAARPESHRQLDDALTDSRSANMPVLMRGAGRSYGDAALNSNGCIVLNKRLNRFIAFNTETGDLVAEAGVTYREIMDAFLPRGYIVPVSPGTAYATLGGAVAMDVHGKNHEQYGTIGRHVQWLEVLDAHGQRIRLSRDENTDWFFATLGGLGLTGVILAVCIRLQKVTGNGVQLEEQRMHSLGEFVTAMQKASTTQSHPYIVGWIDLAAKGAQLGRGILELARLDDGFRTVPALKTLNVPCNAPRWALHRFIVRLFNALYWRRVPSAGRTRWCSLDAFLYPLDKVQNWNRLYGKTGFRQFQCLVPYDNAAAALRQIIELVQSKGVVSPLAVLKTFGAAGEGLLSFPAPGFTLALDIAERPDTLDLFSQLHEIVLGYGGRIYLAKDSALTAAQFKHMYPNLTAYQAVRRCVDPQGIFASDLSRRLQLDGDAHG